MTRNLYFTQGTPSEQKLLQDLVDEQIQMYGIECYYIPRKIYEDRLWNDIYYSEFKEAYLIEMYLESFEEFGGKNDILSKFGLKVTDEINLTVSRRRWKDFVDRATNKIVQGRPNDGDLIFFPLNNNVFEIKFVENQKPFYQLNNLYVYKLNCEIFEYGDSIFNTGIDEIDNLDKETGVFPVTFSVGGTGDFVVGEVITGQTTGKTARVAQWDPTTRTVQVAYSNGNFSIGEAVVGSESGARWTVSKYDTIDLFDDFSENRVIEDNADVIIDFSESNPFGNYGNLGDSF